MLYRGTHLKRLYREFFIMAITTPARVRNSIQAAEVEISDDVVDVHRRADEQAFVETDPQLNLAFDLHRPVRRQGLGLPVRAIRRYLLYDP